jgi:hypothetical protein
MERLRPVAGLRSKHWRGDEMSIQDDIEVIEKARTCLAYDPFTGVFLRLTGPRAGKPAGSATSRDGYVRVWAGSKGFLAHRLAWAFIHGELPKFDLDHIDRDKRNNKLANLRPATRSENMQNHVKARSDNRIGLRGVSRNGPNLFQARIKINGRRISLGNFKTPEAAHAAYVEAKKLHHPAAFLKENGHE